MTSTVASEQPDRVGLEIPAARGGAERPEPAPGTAASGVGEGEARSRPWAVAARNGAGFWLIAMSFYFVVTLCAWQLGNRPQTWAQLFGSWRQWDTWWYLQLAVQGYPAAGDAGPPPPETFYAMYPLFPLLIRGVHAVVPGDVAISAFLVSISTFLGLLIVLYRFLDSELGDAAKVKRAMWYLLAFPTAFFLAAPFSMALFLLLAIASIYFMRRGRWWAAAVLGGVATASRASALLLVGVFALEYLRQREWKISRVRADVAWIALIPVGFLAFLAYAQARMGTAFATFHAQSQYWQHTLDWPWAGPMEAARDVVGGIGPDFVLYPVIDVGLLGAVGLLLVLALVGPYRLDRAQWPLVAYGAGAVLFAISFPMPDLDPIKSTGRYMLEVFPAFMVLANIGRSPWFDRAYVAIALPLQTLLLVIHLHAGWVG